LRRNFFTESPDAACDLTFQNTQTRATKAASSPIKNMSVILSADDFGYSQDTVARTIACIQDGILTSASIMANMPATEAAAAFANSRRDFSFGIHVCFCDGVFERPLCDHSRIPSLTQEDGRFHSTRDMIKRALLGTLKLVEIEHELTAQLARLSDLGVHLSYVDGHGNLHKFAPFVEAMRNVLPRFSVMRVRRTQNIYLEHAFLNPNYWLGTHWNRAIERSFATTNGFFLPASTNDAHWPKPLLRRLKHLSGVIELAVHPGSDDEWREREEANLRIFAREAAATGIEFVDWRDVA
jgi:predicted glycoside hydrolase/deacetylase ChbG (UPF0249 family)